MVVLFVISYFFAFAKAEGAEGIFVNIMAFPAQLFALPFFWIALAVFHVQNPMSFLVTIGLDILLFALIVERLIYYIKVTKSRKEVAFKSV